MENRDLIGALRQMATLLELHDENPFKTRSYQNAAQALEGIETPLQGADDTTLRALPGVGAAMAGHLRELLDTGSFAELTRLRAATPTGLPRLLRLSGLGPRKARQLWRQLDVTTEEALIDACAAGRVAALKGFGEKTQALLHDAARLALSYRGKARLPEAWAAAHALRDALRAAGWPAEVSGEVRRCLPVVTQLTLLVPTCAPAALYHHLSQTDGLRHDAAASGPFAWRGTRAENELPVAVHVCTPEAFAGQWLLGSAGAGHLRLAAALNKPLAALARGEMFASEQDIYHRLGWPYVPPELREGVAEGPMVRAGHVPALLRPEALRGVLHNHSTYSDGHHTLLQMAQACQQRGYQYLGISDHSRTAAYAGGLPVARVVQQHEEIDRLNETLAPFRIFKGIESDILPDGSLDYDEATLARFDFVVASVHAQLNMGAAEATARVLRAVRHPRTTVLGHPTGRLLLRREGYPLDHRAVIDACAECGVVIEINANPWRLDLDWTWVPYALERGVVLSINPDAHSREGLDDVRWGVMMGRKGGLTADHTLNAWPLARVAAHLEQRRSKA